ncbi:hypothetical protein H4R20_004948 [Coemansia guatemalensis]|uniref:Uncharacterized protein n=1 Tax=Coemansia guatemalensis TaxID=2761395 RepID=A0A9W8LSB3_9FUNG|nr:hypothetical protein H4R20_004948 [Coemansia guatemalensis]
MNLGFFRAVLDIDESLIEEQQASASVPSSTEDASRADSMDQESISEYASSGDHPQVSTTIMLI